MLKYKKRRKYKKYVIMKKDGKPAHEIYLAAKTDKLDSVQRLDVLLSVCGLSLTEAKEVMVCTDTDAESLSEYQEKRILPLLRKALEHEDQDSNLNGTAPTEQ